MKNIFRITITAFFLASLCFSAGVYADGISFSTESGREYFIDEYRFDAQNNDRSFVIMDFKFKKKFVNGKFEATDDSMPFSGIWSYDHGMEEKYFSGVPSEDISSNIYYGISNINYNNYVPSLYFGSGDLIAEKPNLRITDNSHILVDCGLEHKFLRQDTNKTEEYASQAVFDNVGEYSGGKAVASLNGQAVLIDTAGNVLKNYGNTYGYIGNYHNGYMFARKSCRIPGAYGYSALPLNSVRGDESRMRDCKKWSSDNYKMFADDANVINDGFLVINESGEVVADNLYGRYAVNANRKYGVGVRNERTILTLQLIDRDILPGGYYITTTDEPYYSIKSSFTSEHKYGIKNLGGETVVDFIYNGYKRFDNKYTLMYLDCGFEIFDDSFNKVIVFYSNDYDRDIRYVDSMNAFLINIYGDYALINVGDGSMQCPFKGTLYASDGSFIFGIGTASGTFVNNSRDKYENEYTANEYLHNSLYLITENGADENDWSGYVGIIDGRDNIVVPVEYRLGCDNETVKKLDRYVPFVSSTTGKVRIFCTNTAEFAEGEYDSFVSCSSNYCLVTKNGEYTYLDNSGNPISPEFFSMPDGGELAVYIADAKKSQAYVLPEISSTDLAYTSAEITYGEITADIEKKLICFKGKTNAVMVFDQSNRPILSKIGDRECLLINDENNIFGYIISIGDRKEFYNIYDELMFYAKKDGIYDYKNNVIADIDNMIYYRRKCSLPNLYEFGNETYVFICDTSMLKNEDKRECSVVAEDVSVLSVNGKTDYFEDENFVFNPRRVDGHLWLETEGTKKALDCIVEYDLENKTVTVKKNDITVVLTADVNRMVVNGNSVYLDQPPRIYDDYVALPVDAIADALGIEYKTDGSRTIFYLS